MILLDLLFVLVIAAILSGIYAAFRRDRGLGVFPFFVILLALTWAAGVWIRPVGYPFLGVYWATFSIAAIFFALLLMAFIPYKYEKKRPTVKGVEVERAVYGTFFWILIVALLLAIIAGYTYEPNQTILTPDYVAPPLE